MLGLVFLFLITDNGPRMTVNRVNDLFDYLKNPDKYGVSQKFIRYDILVYLYEMIMIVISNPIQEFLFWLILLRIEKLKS